MRHLLIAGELTHREKPMREIGSLERYERPLPALTEYDGLLGAVQP